MHMYNDSSDGENGGAGVMPVSQAAGSTSKKRLMRRTKATDSPTGASASTSHVDPAVGLGYLPPAGSGSSSTAAGRPATQIVSSQAEGDALVRRLKQLERENAALANTLAKVCEQNASLTGVIASLEDKVAELSATPLKATPVLHSLFEPDKTGWFGGSKTAARDQLEKLAEALQEELLAYKAGHASTNEEVQAILAAMQISSVNAAEVGRLVNEQQQAMSAGPLAVAVTIVPDGGENSGGGAASLGELRAELRRQQVRCEELQHQVGGLSADLRHKTSDNATLQSQLRTGSSSSAAAASTSGPCSRCESMRIEAAQAAARADTAAAGLQAQLLEAQARLAEQEAAARRSVPLARHAALERERDTLTHDLGFAQQRVATLENKNRAIKAGADADAAPTAPSQLNEAAVLDTLDKNKERISRVEFERDQATEQLRQAQAYAVKRDEDAQRVERTATEDKQRVAFLIKKCAVVTADLRTATVARDALSEELDRTKVEVRQLQRQVESSSGLQRQCDELAREKAQNEARLASAEELEDKLVKAKETIAYMELAQTSSINMSQYAELKAANEKLTNTMAPLKKQLDEAHKENERLKSVTNAQQMVTGSQLTSVQNMQDQLAAATASEAKLREKVAALTADNERLAKVNASLESQMADMQDGIKEMAMQMETQRTSAETKATSNSQKRIDELQSQLNKATQEMATVQATTGQFVAEGLYQNVCADRDRLTEEGRKRAVDGEKMKSEILIYRQTIADLEAENDEHVKEIEALQDRYQGDRTALSERASGEQKRSAELVSTVESLVAQAKARDAQLEQSAAAVKDLQELLSRQKRAFEDKCTAEEKLTAQLAALQSTNVTLQSSYEKQLSQARAASAGSSTSAAPVAFAAAGPSSSSSSPLHAAGDSGASAAELATLKNRVYQVQCDNDKMHGELKKLHLKHKMDADDDQRTIQMLQVQIKSRMPADTRAAYEAEVGRSAALRSTNEELTRENEDLRRKVAACAAAIPSAGVLAAELPTAALPTNAAELQAHLLQLQQQISVQKSGFDAAMTQAIADAEAKQQRIDELEADLREAEGGAAATNHHTRNSSMSAAAVSAGAGLGDDDEDDGGLSQRPKKKIKKIKKKTLAEQVAAGDPAADVLTQAQRGDELTAGGAAAAAADSDDLRTQLRLAQSDLLRSQRELELLRKENAALKDSVAQLTTDLTNAMEDLDHAQAAADEERADFEKRIYELEARAKATPLGRGVGDPPARRSHSNSGIDFSGSSNRSFSRQTSLQETEMALRTARDENDRLQLEVRQLKNQVSKASSKGSAGAAGPPVAPPASEHELNAFRRAVQQKDAEIQSLADQLVPTKNKLVEYMAMADRLGLQYPFPPQLEGPTVMRLRAMNIQSSNRATSAPAQQGAATAAAGRAGTRAAAHDTSPAPRPPPGARRVNRAAPRGAGAAAPQYGAADELDDLR